MRDQLFARIESLFDVEAFHDLRVMIAGCGSGGGYVAQQLVMSGVKRFTLVDKEELEVENVIRHVCGARYLGWRKTTALADVLRDRNPQVDVREFDEDLLGWRGLEQEVEQSSVVVVGTDNEPSRYRLNEVCVETATPFTVGRVFTRGIGGEVYSYRPQKGGCLACLERLLERSQYRDGVREIDLVSKEERQKVYDLGNRGDQGFAWPIGRYWVHRSLPHAVHVGRTRPRGGVTTKVHDADRSQLLGVGE